MRALLLVGQLQLSNYLIIKLIILEANIFSTAVVYKLLLQYKLYNENCVSHHILSTWEQSSICSCVYTSYNGIRL
jgi:hypothetical protein